MRIICQIYKSSRREETYLYVDKARDLEDVPEALMKRFGKPQPLMVVVLEKGKKLARAEVRDVMQQITATGYYLQMPPTAAQLFKREGSAQND